MVGYFEDENEQTSERNETKEGKKRMAISSWKYVGWDGQEDPMKIYQPTGCNTGPDPPG
jgi:hypothetical protein